tara:strand:+ start:5359 stop:6243 length:885 start_codon:yes stop_codon:yes gene_type:complete
MTAAEMHTAVDILFDKEDTLNYPNFQPEHKDFFLNLAQDRFVKHRYDGANARGKGVENTQKRSDDLKNVTDSASITPLANQTDNYPNGRFVPLPSTVSDLYWFALTEQADVTRQTCSKKIIASGKIKDGQLYIVLNGSVIYDGTTYTSNQSFTGTTTTSAGIVVTVTTYTGTGSVYEAKRDRVNVKPSQHDDINKTLEDPFNKPVLDDKGKSLLRRLEFQSRIEVLFPHSDHIFNSYIVRYIRKPQRISLSLATDCELADHTHQEVVDMAVSSMLENIESDRYKSNLNELNKLE